MFIILKELLKGEMVFWKYFVCLRVFIFWYCFFFKVLLKGFLRVGIVGLVRIFFISEELLVDLERWKKYVIN